MIRKSEPKPLLKPIPTFVGTSDPPFDLQADGSAINPSQTGSGYKKNPYVNTPNKNRSTYSQIRSEKSLEKTHDRFVVSRYVDASPEPSPNPRIQNSNAKNKSAAKLNQDTDGTPRDRSPAAAKSPIGYKSSLKEISADKRRASDTEHLRRKQLEQEYDRVTADRSPGESSRQRKPRAIRAETRAQTNASLQAPTRKTRSSCRSLRTTPSLQSSKSQDITRSGRMRTCSLRLALNSSLKTSWTNRRKAGESFPTR